MARETPTSVSGLGRGFGWQLFAPAAAAFLLLFLLGLWFSHQTMLHHARAKDMERAEHSLRLAERVLLAEAAIRPPEEIIRSLQANGLANVHLLPADRLPRGTSPRYISPGSYAEAWTELHSPDGTTLGILHVGPVSDSGRLALSIIRRGAATAVSIFALVLLVLWLTVHFRVTHRLRRLIEKLEGLAGGGAPPDSDEDPIRACSTAVDNALRFWQAEESSRQNQLDLHEEMACVLSPEGNFRQSNRAAKAFFGRTPEDMEGTGYLDLIPAADRTDAAHSLRRLTATHPDSTVEHRMVLPDGTIRWTRWRHHADFNNDGAMADVLSFGTDITSAKELSSAISDLRTAFDQMQSLAHTGSLTWNFSADRMDWTNETFRLLGLGHERVQPSLENLLGVVAPSDRDALRHCLISARETGEPFELEFAVLRPDGSQRVLQSRAEVRADPQTKLLDQLTCALRDITSLRAAEAATRRELNRRQAVEQSLASGIVIHDDRGRLVSANPAFCAMIGWTKSELLGLMPPFPYWPPEEIDTIAETFTRSLAGDAADGSVELRFQRRDTTRLDVLVKGAPLLDDQGHRHGWLESVTDVTSLKEAQRRLADANNQLATAREIAEFGTWAWNPETGEIVWDERSFEIFGHPGGTDAVAVWRSLQPVEETARAERSVRQSEQNGLHTGRFRITIRRPDDSECIVESSFRRVAPPGSRTPRFIGVHRDITREVRRERDLLAANERLSMAAAVAGFGTWEWNPETDELTWDRVTFNILGQPKAQDEKSVWQESLPPEVQEQITARLMRQIKEGAEGGHELLEITTPDGELRRVVSSYRILRDPKGRVLTVLGVNTLRED